MQLYDVTIIIGIITFPLFLITMLLGMKTNILPAVKRRKLHIIFAILTLVCAGTHVALALYMKYLM
jgi:Mg2+ and Co2+ transporter CorA